MTHARRQCLSDLVFLRGEQVAEATGVDARSDLLADQAHDKRGQHAQQRAAADLSEARKLPASPGKRCWLFVAGKRWEQAGSFSDEGGRFACSVKLSKGFGHAGWLLDGAAGILAAPGLAATPPKAASKAGT